MISEERRSYLKLCTELHKKTFDWTVPNDDNRCEDGKALRYRFVDEYNLSERSTVVQEFLEEDCSLFEVIVALARRIDDLLFDHRKGERPYKWFLEMITNLGLDEYDDNHSSGRRFDPVAEAEINEIMTNLVDRTYGKDGHGSLFPLKAAVHQNMRRVEIWYQMMAWLAENYEQ